MRRRAIAIARRLGRVLRYDRQVRRINAVVTGGYELIGTSAYDAAVRAVDDDQAGRSAGRLRELIACQKLRAGTGLLDLIRLNRGIIGRYDRAVDGGRRYADRVRAPKTAAVIDRGGIPGGTAVPAPDGIAAVDGVSDDGAVVHVPVVHVCAGVIRLAVGVGAGGGSTIRVVVGVTAAGCVVRTGRPAGAAVMVVVTGVHVSASAAVVAAAVAIRTAAA
jgi:hypothetical protein